MKNKVEFFRFKTNRDTIVFRDNGYFVVIGNKYSDFTGRSGFGMWKAENYEDNVTPLTTEEVADLASKSLRARELLGAGHRAKSLKNI